MNAKITKLADAAALIQKAMRTLDTDETFDDSSDLVQEEIGRSLCYLDAVTESLLSALNETKKEVRS